MNILVQFCRIFVGALFIFSGMIKLNDPLGFSYKLQEYFSAEVLDIPFLMPYALGISVIVVVLEVVLGVFLLIGYKPKFTVYSLLAMIVFFTFLTFYAAYFDKVKDCGCFGDFLKLTPWQSFTKDVILLVLILVLVLGLKHIKPLFNALITTVLALFGFIFSLGFGYYVLEHLPVWDFRAYKIGDNIKANMTVPEDAPKEVSEWTWTFNVNGEEKQFVTNGSYPKVDGGEYVSYEKKVITPGTEPKIFDFSIESQDENLTDYFLEKENLVIVVSYNLNNANAEGLKEIKTFTDKAIANGYTVIGVTASGEDLKQSIKDSFKLNFDFYLCDEKVGKTIVRANPGVIMLQKGTVTQKAHYNDLDDLQISKVTPEANSIPISEIEEDALETVYFIDGEETTKDYADALDAETIEGVNVVKDTLNASGEAKINRVEVSLKPKN